MAARQKCGKKPGQRNTRYVVPIFKEIKHFGGVPVAVFALQYLPRTGTECTSYRSVVVSHDVAARFIELQAQVALLNEE